MYAIIKTGGKQYSVKVGDIIKVEKLPAEIGENYTFDFVALAASENETKVGNPYIDGATVVAKVIDQNKHKKIIVYKYKSKKGSKF